MQIKNKLRFSLRTLLIVTSGLMIWLAKLSNDARNQANAVKAIEAAQGHIEFKQLFNAPEWLKNIFGEEFFRNVITDGLTTNNASFADDQTLKHIRCLTSLKKLELGWNAKITDEGLKHLRGLNNLEELHLYRTQIHGPGLKYLVDLPHLQWLSLSDTPVDDSAATHLKNLRALESLRMDNTRISDAAMSEIAKSRNIKTLVLYYTEISDVGMKSLEQLKSLETLNLRYTNVTTTGISSFERALPNCNLFHSFHLRKTPTDQSFFADGYQPNAIEINNKFKELDIDGEVTTDPKRAGKPIVRFRLFSSTLSDDAILSLIKLMPEVEELNFRRLLIGDEFLKKLDAPNLHTIAILGTLITDEGLKVLAKFKNLRDLEFAEISLSDKGLSYLSEMSQLKRLQLRSTKVTAQGMAKLKKALPKCQIQF